MTLPPCPWCGDEPIDEEMTDDDFGAGGYCVTSCASCNRPIQITRLVTVTYTVEQVEEP